MHFHYTMQINRKKKQTKKKEAKFIDIVSVWRFEKDHFLHFPGQNQNKLSFANVYLPKEKTFSIQT